MSRRALLGLLAVLALFPASAAAQSPSPAATTLSQCVETTGRLDVLFVIDESGSIYFTDPHGQRVDGVDAALSGFARLAAGSAGQRPIAVKTLFEGFYGRVSPNPDTPDTTSRWQPVSEQTLPGLLAQAGQFRARNRGEDTDYALAFLAARKLLAREAVAETESGGPPPCKAIVWFTDGGYDITARTQSGPAALPAEEPYAPGIDLDSKQGAATGEAAGRQYLCRSGGLLDGLQSDGVVKFTFGLSHSMTSYDQNFLQAVTTGQGGGIHCGGTLSARTGQYQPITENQCLFFSFGGLLDGSGCPPPTSLRALNAFRTIPGLTGFQLRAITGGAHINIQITGPDRHTATFIPGATGPVEAAGARISPRWFSDRAVELNGGFPNTSSSWVGPWSYVFIDPTGAAPSAVPIAQVQLLAGLTPRLGPQRVVRGATTRLRLYLTGPTGAAVTSGELLADARPTATLTEPQTGTTTVEPIGARRADGSFEIPVALPANLTEPYVLLTIGIPFASATGAEIMPLRRIFQLPVGLPPGQGYPSVTPSSLELKSIEGHGTSTANLTVRAQPNSGGCVWATGARLTAPSGTRGISSSVTPDATSEQTCVKLASGRESHLRVSFTVAHAAVGTGSARVAIHVRSDLARQSATIVLTGSLELYPPQNIAKRVAILIAALVVGTLIPLLLLLALNYFSALFTPSQSLLRLVLDVIVIPGIRVDQAGTSNQPPQAPRLSFDWVDPTGHSRPRRKPTLDTTPAARPDAPELPIELRGVTARRPADLFMGPSGTALTPDHILIIGDAGRVTTSAGRMPAEVSLRLPGRWMFIVERVVSSDDVVTGPRLAEIHGRLVLLLSLSPGLNDGQELADAARRELISIDWASLVAEAGKPPPESLLERLKTRLGLRGDGERNRDETEEWPGYELDPDAEEDLTANGGSGPWEPPSTNAPPPQNGSPAGEQAAGEEPDRPTGGRHF